MKLLNDMMNAVSTKAQRAGLVVQKNSPEILLGLGIVGFIGTIVLASKAAIKAKEVLEEHENTVNEIKEAMELAKEEPDAYDYNEDDMKKDIQVQYCKTGVEMVKVYAPVITLGALSLACIFGSRNVMQKRYLNAVAAYNALSGAYEMYRDRVKERYGEQIDYDIRHGITRNEIETTSADENGKKIKSKEEVANIDPSQVPSAEAVFFDSNNPNWDKNPNFSLMFLRAQQNYLNDLLHTRGHVFLNEVYDALGFPHTQTGALVGWVDGFGNNNIDFGLYNIENEKARRFVNGEENVYLLDFNHDGIIYDKI